MMRFYAMLILLTFLIGCGDNKKNGSITSEQKEIFSYLPDDTWFLTFMKVNKLKNSELWDYFKASILDKNIYDNSFKTFEEETGISLDDGVSSVFTASSKKNRDFFIAVFDKNFDKIKNFFDENLYSLTLGDKKIYKTDENSRVLFYFVSKSTLIVLRDKSYLQKLIKSQNKSLLENHDFLKTIGGISNKTEYWMAAGRGNYLINLFEKSFGISKTFSGNKLLKSVEDITLSASFDEGVEIESDWICNNSKDAYLLSTAAKGVFAMDLISKSNYILGKILQKTEVQSEDKSVNFQLELDQDNIEELKNITNKTTIEKIL